MRREFIDRFWSRVAKEGVAPDDCWEWRGTRYPNGYGAFYSGRAGSRSLAHRWIMQETLGRPLPPEELVCHRCDNPPCVNPAHLFVGTQTDNMRDCLAKGRMPKTRAPRAKRGPLTQCRKGHALTPDNMYRFYDATRGERIRCHICIKASKAKYRASVKAGNP